MLQELLSEECVVRLEQVGSAREAISILSTRLVRLVGIDAGVIERAVMDRERARTTAFSNGAAIPHCRLTGLRRFAAAMMILQCPVRWDEYGQTVDTVMLILGPTDHVPDHLRVLANSSHLLDSRAVRAKLRSAPDAAAIRAVITSAENAIERRRSELGILQEVHKDPGQSAARDDLAEAMTQFPW